MGNKIMIIGNAGGGKSTLAKRLSQSRNLPLYRLDALQWNSGWIPTSKAEFDRRHDELISQDVWIIDGFASWESIETRCAAADTIILVDLPLWIHYWWTTKRQFMCLFRPRPDFVQGCPMLPMTGKLLKMIWIIYTQVRPKLVELVVSYRETKWIYHIKSPREMEQVVIEHC
ncbi:flagellar protein FlaR [Pleurocapsales cyanobacterium LEGE 10410]|nr:flagellar protein FlaR [Pleurocapsales cyanobacterium LEGE 10410]